MCEFAYLDQTEHIPVWYGNHLEAIRCHARQRTVQYELVEVHHTPVLTRGNAISEVLNPLTGELVSPKLALEAGWLESTPTGEFYVDSSTGQKIPIDDAIFGAQVHLANLETNLTRNLLLIERITFSWCPVRITSYTDVVKQIQYTLSEAMHRGWFKLSAGEPIIFDLEQKKWLKVEEATGRGVIQIAPIEYSERRPGSAEETFTCRVFLISSIRPGGELGNWMNPSEAAQLGLFNWQTGEVAAEWDADDPDENIVHNQHFVPTKWISLLEARRARWVRLQFISYPEELVHSMRESPEMHSLHRILSTHVHLVAPSTVPVPSKPSGDSPSQVECSQPRVFHSAHSGQPTNRSLSPPTRIGPPVRGTRLLTPPPNYAKIASQWDKPLRSPSNPERWSRHAPRKPTLPRTELRSTQQQQQQHQIPQLLQHRIPEQPFRSSDDSSSATSLRQDSSES